MKSLKVSLMLLLLLLSYSTFLVRIKDASANSASIQVFPDGSGIRIVVRDIELYFNATNGGEITEYFDLTVDPSRSRNLVNMRWKPFYNLLQLFASIFYN